MALFGTPDNVEILMTDPSVRFEVLKNRSLDLLTETTTHTLGRDIFESLSEYGFTFSMPYLYTGLIFAGMQPYLDCADNLDSFTGDCRDLRICVTMDTTHLDTLGTLLPGPALVPGANFADLVVMMKNQECNVIAGESTFLPAQMDIQE